MNREPRRKLFSLAETAAALGWDRRTLKALWRERVVRHARHEKGLVQDRVWFDAEEIERARRVVSPHVHQLLGAIKDKKLNAARTKRAAERAKVSDSAPDSVPTPLRAGEIRS